MKFETNIFQFRQTSDFKINFSDFKLPTHRDVFFRAKQYEMYEQYHSARIFLNETETSDWKYWFEVDNVECHQILELEYMGRMFETALLYYNIVVDLSWVLCYGCAEYILYNKDTEKIMVDMSNPLNIEDAYNAMRKTEGEVANPDVQKNPLEY